MNGRWPDPLTVMLAIVSAALVAVIGYMLVGCAPSEPEPAPEPVIEYRTVGLAVDVTDMHAMHTLGLPTKADMVQYHVYGRWGWHVIDGEGSESVLFTTIPGGTEVWDALYGLDHGNGSFKY